MQQPPNRAATQPGGRTTLDHFSHDSAAVRMGVVAIERLPDILRELKPFFRWAAITLALYLLGPQVLPHLASLLRL